MAKKKSDWRAELAQAVEQLRDPFRMRVAVAGVTLVTMFFAISEPLHGRIKRSKSELTTLQTKAKTAEEIILLQARLEAVEPRIMRGESNDVVTSHLIELVREQSVDLMEIDASPPSKVGPMDSIRVDMTVIGSFQSLSKLLSRIERDEFLIRVEQISISPPTRNQRMSTMKLSLRTLRDKS